MVKSVPDHLSKKVDWSDYNKIVHLYLELQIVIQSPKTPFQNQV